MASKVIRPTGGGISSIVEKPAAPLSMMAAGAPAPAAPKVAPVVMPNIQSHPEYDQAYQNALGAARGSIAAQVRNALAETNRAAQVGQQQAGTLTPTVNKVAATQRGGLVQMARGADTAQRDTGFRSYTPGQQTIDPNLSAMDAYRQFSADAVPLIQSGVQDRAAGRQAAIEQYRLGAENDINMQQAQFDQARAMQQREIDAQIRARAEDREYSQDNSLRNMMFQYQLGQMGADADLVRDTKLGQSKADTQVNESTGVTNKRTQEILKSKPYSDVIRGLQNGQMSAFDVYRTFQQVPDYLAVLLDNVPELAAVHAQRLGELGLGGE